MYIIRLTHDVDAKTVETQELCFLFYLWFYLIIESVNIKTRIIHF